MTFLGVPILDWVLMLVVLGFGVEAFLTTRPDHSGSPPAERDGQRPAQASPAHEDD